MPDDRELIEKLLHQADQAKKGTEVLLAETYLVSREEQIAALRTFFEEGTRICERLLPTA